MRADNRLLRFLGFRTQGDLGPWTFYTSKRHGLVWFAKSPPLEPPSDLQTHRRNQFRLIASVWRTLSRDQKNRWKTLAARARLQITYYDLFVYYIKTNDRACIRTLENQTKVTVLPLVRPS